MLIEYSEIFLMLVQCISLSTKLISLYCLVFCTLQCKCLRSLQSPCWLFFVSGALAYLCVRWMPPSCRRMQKPRRGHSKKTWLIGLPTGQEEKEEEGPLWMTREQRRKKRNKVDAKISERKINTKWPKGNWGNQKNSFCNSLKAWTLPGISVTKLNECTV